MARHKVDIVNVNTAEIEVLSNDEMILLFKDYQNGNTDAKEKLVSGNLKLVLSILSIFMLSFIIFIAYLLISTK